MNNKTWSVICDTLFKTLSVNYSDNDEEEKVGVCIDVDVGDIGTMERGVVVWSVFDIDKSSSCILK